MKHNKGTLSQIFNSFDFGSSVAETDDLLETARVETSVFSDLLNDRVDLVPGTKGSGKSALYRIFVDFLPDMLLQQRKVVVAHGVQPHGDNVFHAFADRFEKLDESAFVDFWCIYLVSLAHEHFLKEEKYTKFLKSCKQEIGAFRRSCQLAGIPEIQSRKPLREVLDWVLSAVKSLRPKVSYSAKEEKFEVDLFGHEAPASRGEEVAAMEPTLPKYINDVKDDLLRILAKADLSLWLMVDRLDEIFLRRSAMETKALRGLLRTLQIFQSSGIRVKIFLRDDILDQVTSTGEGFTGLTHITSRQADKLSWSEDQILTLVVNRLFASSRLRDYLNVDRDQLSASSSYRKDAFYRVFPATVHSGPNQSTTLRWIYNHTMDGRGVVTPRDVIDLLARAKQRQQDEFKTDPSGETEVVIGSSAITYGLTELSKRKKETLLKAEFPHFWAHIEKFMNAKRSTAYLLLRGCWAEIPRRLWRT
jgi:hypothetical protein